MTVHLTLVLGIFQAAILFSLVLASWYLIAMRVTVWTLAVLSRLSVVALQFLANHLIADHDAGVFLSPRSPDSVDARYDWIVEGALGGLRRWDGQYFMHVAEYGYTYENTLAFFPLFPLFVRVLAQMIHSTVPIFSLRATLLLVAVALNISFFGKAAECLYELSRLIFRSRIRAKIAVALFCINPASIFFTAPYSESLYCWLTFAFLRDCLKEISVQQTFPLSLSILSRSNGLINVCFLIYVALRRFVAQFNVTTFLNIVFKSAVISFFVVFHFGLLNAYHYYLFCHHLNIKFPVHIRDYAAEKGFVLAGNKTDDTSSWCSNAIPMAYSYVQEKYWDVGFLRYYQWKQWPNFLLAAPIILIITVNFLRYVRQNAKYVRRLGLVPDPALTYFDQASFVFQVHAMALTVFCALFVHIQVTTRLVASSSPMLYWIAANRFHYFDSVSPAEVKSIKSRPKIHNSEEETDIIDTGFLRRVFLDKSNRWGQVFIVWFLSYSIIGTILFSNFLPWS